MKKLLFAGAAALSLLGAGVAHATISQPNVQIIDAGNGVTTVFNYNFLIPYQSDNVTPAVEVQTIDTSGNVVTLAPSQYTISGVGMPSGGTVSYLPSGGPLPAGWQLVITRALAYTQPIAVSNYSFYPHTVEVTSDNLDAQVQQLALQAANSLQFSPGESGFTLPVPTNRENTVLGFGSSGQPVLVPNGGGGGGGSPCGTTGELQFYSSGVFGCTSNLTWNGTAQALTTTGVNVSSTNPNIVGSANETVGANFAVTTDNFLNSPDFGDNLNLAAQLNVSGFGISMQSAVTDAKTTFSSFLLGLSSTASGQNVLLAGNNNSYGAGDVIGIDVNMGWRGQTTSGDEGKISLHTDNLQLNFTPGEPIASITENACAFFLNEGVVGSKSVQTVTGSGTCSGPWAALDRSLANGNSNESWALINSSTSGTVTGVFPVDAPAEAFTMTQSGYVVTVTAITPPNLVVIGQSVNGAGVPTGEILRDQLTGDTGGTGTYYANMSATIGSPIAVTSYGVLENTWTIGLASCNGYCGQNAYWVNTSRGGYSTGDAAGSHSDGTFTGSGGASWGPTSAGGDINGPGCIKLDADDYSGAGWNDAGGPSYEYYPVTEIVDTTHLGIFRTDVAGARNYMGLGTTAGTYQWSECSQSLVQGPTYSVAGPGALGPAQFVVDNASTWAVNDNIQEPNSPYPDVTDESTFVGAWSVGGTYRYAGRDIVITGRVPFDSVYGVNTSEFQPSDALPLAVTGGVYTCPGLVQVCVESVGALSFAYTEDKGQSGWEGNFQNVTGTGTQGGFEFGGFLGGDIALKDIYSAAGTALPACSVPGTMAFVSDATTPSWGGTYTSGGSAFVLLGCTSAGAWKVL